MKLQVQIIFIWTHTTYVLRNMLCIHVECLEQSLEHHNLNNKQYYCYLVWTTWLCSLPKASWECRKERTSHPTWAEWPGWSELWNGNFSLSLVTLSWTICGSEQMGLQLILGRSTGSFRMRHWVIMYTQEEPMSSSCVR